MDVIGSNSLSRERNGTLVSWGILALAFGLVTVMLLVDLLVSKPKEERLFERNASGFVVLAEEAVKQILQKSDQLLARIVQTHSNDMLRAQAHADLKELATYRGMQTPTAQNAELSTIVKHPGALVSAAGAQSEFESLEDAVNKKLKQELVGAGEWQPESLRLINARGDVVYMSGVRDGTTGVNVKDRPYFQSQVTSRSMGMQVSAPIKSQLSNKWLLPVTRRFTNADGSFAGIAVVFVRVDYLKDLFSKISIGEASSLALVASDGGVVVRSPELANETDVEFTNDALFKAPENGVAGGRILAKSLVDKKEYVVRFKRIPDTPLIVMAGLSGSDMLTNWYRKATLYAVSLTLIAFMLGGLWRISEFSKKTNRATEGARKHYEVELARLACQRAIDDASRSHTHTVVAAMQASLTHIEEVSNPDDLAAWRDYVVDQVWCLGAIDTKTAMLTRVASGAGLESSETKDVAKAIAIIAQDSLLVAANKGIEFRYVNTELQYVKYSVDASAFDFAIKSLIANAFRFTKSGFVSLECSIHDSDNGHVLKTIISNSGFGLTAEKRTQMKSALGWGSDRSIHNNFEFMGLSLIGAVISANNGNIRIGDEGSALEIIVDFPVK